MQPTLRPATPADRDLLAALYASTRDDLRRAGLPPGQLDELLELQFTAQSTDYRRRFPDSEHSIIESGGEAVGRIWIDRGPDEIRLLDIALLPERRNLGIGGALLGQLIAEARLAGRPLRHSVQVDNLDGLRFYRRLGFEIVETLETYVLMEWTATRPDG